MNSNTSVGGSILRQLRERRNLTQEQLGLAIGVSGTTIRNWETGRTEARLTFGRTKLLCKALQCTLEELPDQVGFEETDS